MSGVGSHDPTVGNVGSNDARVSIRTRARRRRFVVSGPLSVVQTQFVLVEPQCRGWEGCRIEHLSVVSGQFLKRSAYSANRNVAAGRDVGSDNHWNRKSG